MEDFSSKIEKPTDIRKNSEQSLSKAGYEELGPFGKAVVGVGAAFLTLKVAVLHGACSHGWLFTGVA